MGSTCACAMSSTACGDVQRIAWRTNLDAFACPQLRHPNVLQFKDTAEVEERGETVIYLVTEAVAPLVDHLQRLDIQVPCSPPPACIPKNREWVAPCILHSQFRRFSIDGVRARPHRQQ